MERGQKLVLKWIENKAAKEVVKQEASGKPSKQLNHWADLWFRAYKFFNK